jgi:hypothetical protein
MSGNCDFFKGQLGGHQIQILTTLTSLLPPSEIHRNWKADQYGICGQLCRQNGLFQLAQKLLPTWANWTRQLHSNAEATPTHLAGEIGPRSYTAYRDYLAPAFDPATRGEDTTSQPSVAGRQKADQLSQITKANEQD